MSGGSLFDELRLDELELTRSALLTAVVLTGTQSPSQEPDLIAPEAVGELYDRLWIARRQTVHYRSKAIRLRVAAERVLENDGSDLTPLWRALNVAFPDRAPWNRPPPRTRRAGE